MPRRAPRARMAVRLGSASQAAASLCSGSRRSIATARCTMSAPVVIRRDMVRRFTVTMDARSGILCRCRSARVEDTVEISLVRRSYHFERLQYVRRGREMSVTIVMVSRHPNMRDTLIPCVRDKSIAVSVKWPTLSEFLCLRTKLGFTTLHRQWEFTIGAHYFPYYNADIIEQGTSASL